MANRKKKRLNSQGSRKTKRSDVKKNKVYTKY
jgi:hypothetical protein